MWGLSIREGIKILIVTLLATILAVIIQLVVVSGADTLFSVISSPQNLVDSLYQAFSLPISSFSLFVILVTMFAFSTSFLNSIYSVLAGGVELRPSVKAEKPKKENEAPFGITIALLCAAEFFSGLGNGILMPITTAFLMYALGTSPTEMGLAFSIGWGLATALAQIPGGRLTDKFGAKKVIVGCLLGATPLVLIQPLSTNVLQFSLILRIICFIGMWDM